MNLKHFHDFTNRDDYPLPFVLVYRGHEHELMDIGLHCKMYCKTGEFVAMDMMQVSLRDWVQSFHFLHKSDAMFCKLRHDV